MSKDGGLSTAPTRPAVQAPGPMPRAERRAPPTLTDVLQAFERHAEYTRGQLEGIARESSDVRRAVTSMASELREHGQRLDALESAERAVLAQHRDRLPSLSEARDTSELQALDAQAGVPPSLPDRIARLEGSEIRTRRHATRGPVISAALISLALALADVAKAYFLHR